MYKYILYVTNATNYIAHPHNININTFAHEKEFFSSLLFLLLFSYLFEPFEFHTQTATAVTNANMDGMSRWVTTYHKHIVLRLPSHFHPHYVHCKCIALGLRAVRLRYAMYYPIVCVNGLAAKHHFLDAKSPLVLDHPPTVNYNHKIFILIECGILYIFSSIYQM